jgi:O-antigen biosynthesis protein
MLDIVAGIVIVNWNGRELLDKCLSSLFANTSEPRCKVIVVDNASTDGSAEMVQRSYPQVKLIKNSVNAGFSKANNQGIQFALQNGVKYVLLLNNDVEITNKIWLKEFTTVIESDKKIGIVGCKLVFPDGTLQHAGGLVKLRVPYNRGEFEKDTGQYDHVELVDYVTGAALMIKAEVIHKIGLIDEGFSPLYYEDTDWCVRAHLYGYGIAYTPKPTLIHHCGASSNKVGSERKKFYAKRSFIRFVLLNYPVVDILKRTLVYESRETLRCLIVKPKRGPLLLTLRSDAASRLVVFLRPWIANIHNVKEILYLRRQRYSYVAKLHV